MAKGYKIVQSLRWYYESNWDEIAGSERWVTRLKREESESP